MLDLSAAFDTLDHQLLVRRLASILGISGTALAWFQSYLTNRQQRILLDSNILSDPKSIGVGVPQGSVLGPLLFNIYTKPLYEICCADSLLSGYYADDSQIYLICKVANLVNSMQRVEKCVSTIKSWMVSNRLKLNGDKTELTVFASSYFAKQLPPTVLVVDEVPISPKPACRNLGVLMDQHLAMDSHVNSVVKSSYFHLSNIMSIRSLLDQRTTESLIHAFVSSRLDYCNSLLFGITFGNIIKLQRVQNKAARICLKISRKSRISSISLLRQLHWLPITFRIEFKILLLTYKCLNGFAPSYLSELLHHHVVERSSRSSDLGLLIIPKSRTKSFGDRSFEVAAPRLWNELPLSIRQSGSVAEFKRQLKTHLCNRAYL